MDPFLSRREVQKILSECQVIPSRALGQSFLVDRNTLEKIISELEICYEDIVLEIGPGLGALTGYLLEKSKKVLTVEIDSKLAEFLKARFYDQGQFAVLNQDFLEVDLETVLRSLSAEMSPRGQLKIVGNLPYCVSTQILFKLLECPVRISKMVLAFQWEVAERLLAGPHSKEYGAMTLGVQYFSQIKKVMRIRKTCFFPEPEVDTGILSFGPRNIDFGLTLAEEKVLFQLIRSGFSQRRKTLKNALVNSREFKNSPEEIERVLANCGLKEKVRAEDLTLQEFVNLLQSIIKIARAE